MKHYLLLAAALALPMAACSKSDAPAEQTADATAEQIDKKEPKPEQVTDPEKTTEKLADILAAQPDNVKARYQYRNPQATLEFFGVEPGMTVAEVLPGGGWYSKILLPYLGDEGHLIGIDYSIDMWQEFGGFADADYLEGKKTWATKWTADAQEWQNGGKTQLSAFAFGSAPEDMLGTVDVVFLPRAIHHLNRFDQAHMPGALADIKTILKPDGIVGIVAHRASEDQPDDWANGDNGYMKQSTVIQIMEEAGFELVRESEINANPKDQATAANEDMVWRLPPTLGTSREDPELRAKMEAIGETDRMTLKFKIKE
ncbi:MAG: class I SAM-dependent methyltransferase [Hellea sp.]|nr:class I SAM-dependent methyltransferase [Hellea sp.]